MSTAVLPAPDEHWLAEEFPQPADLIYMNHAGVAPWPARTARAVGALADEIARIGASRYPDWLAKERELREQFRRLLNAPSADDIALLKNTSEAISVIAAGLDWRWGDNIVTTDQEFPSNRIPWEAQRRHGVTLREVSIEGEDPEAALMAACDPRTRVMAVSSVQFGSGIRLDLARLGRHCRGRGILFSVDAIQSLGAVPFDVRSVQADFVMADAHKWMLGPEGLAVFYCRAELRPTLELRQFGWHMVEDAGNYAARDWRPAASARRFECGTPNMLGVFASSASLTLLEDFGIERVARRLSGLCSRLFDGLRALPGVELVTPGSEARRAGIVTFRVAGADPVELHARLARRRLVCAARAGGIRLSPHFYLPQSKIDNALDIIRITI